MKQNKSTTNLNNNTKIKLTNSKTKTLKDKKFDITNSPKFKYREKKNLDNFYNNKRNKSIDYKYMSCKNNKTSNNKKNITKYIQKVIIKKIYLIKVYMIKKYLKLLIVKTIMNMAKNQKIKFP